MKNIQYITKVYCIDDEEWIRKLISMMRYSENMDVYAAVLRVFMKDISCAAKICHMLLEIKEKDLSGYMMLTEKLVAVDDDDKKKV